MITDVTNETDTADPEFISIFCKNKTMYFNVVILSFCWLMVGLNYYGFLNSWCKISIYHLKFENDLLSTVLGKTSKYPLKNWHFEKTLDGILCLLGEF